MSTTEEVLRVRNEVTGGAVLRDLEAQLKTLATEQEQLTAAYKAGAVAQSQLEAETQRLGTAKAGLTDQIGALKGGFKNTGMAALELSRGLEDLQYGFAGMANNLPQIALALGGSAGLTAVITLLGVGINQLVKHWDDITRAMEAKNPFPEAGNNISQMKRELDTAKDAMKELEKHSSLTASELEKYNGLRAKTAAIEERIAAAVEKRKQLEALEKLPDAAKADEAKERADSLKDSFGGDEKHRMAGSMQRSIQRDAESEVFEAMDNINRAEPGSEAEKRAKKQLARARFLASDSVEAEAERRKQAMATMADAIDAGSATNRESYDRMRGQAEAHPQFYTAHQRAAIHQASPEAFQEDRDFEAGNERAKASRQKREADAKQKEAEVDAGIEQNDFADAENLRLWKAGQARKKRREAAAKQAETKAATEKRKADAEQKKRVDEAARQLEPANLKQQAEAVYLQSRDQGATHRQAAAQAQQFVNQSVAQLNPGLDERTSQGVSQKIGGDASADLQRRSMALQTRGLSVQGRAIEIMAQLNAEVAQTGQRLMAFESALSQIQLSVESRSKQNNGAGAR